MKKKKKNNLIKKNFLIISYNLLCIFFILIIFEIFSGDYFYKKRLKCSYILCNASYNYSTDLYTNDKIKINYNKDQYGFRGRTNKIDNIDILTIGGSTTDERYLNLENTWSEKLEKLFLNDFINIDIVNAGIDGQSTYGHIWNFENWFSKIKNLQFKYIIFYIGINEKEYAGRHDLNLDEVNYPKKILYLIKYNNGIISKLYEFFFIKNNPIDSLNVAHSKYRNTTYIPIKNEEYYFNTKFLSNNLEKLILLSKSMNSIPIFVSQRTLRWKFINNSLHSIDENNYYLREKIISDKIIEICTKYSLLCINGFTDINLDTNDTYDLVHTNPNGSNKIATLIYESIKNLFYEKKLR